MYKQISFDWQFMLILYIYIFIMLPVFWLHDTTWSKLVKTGSTRVEKQYKVNKCFCGIYYK